MRNACLYNQTVRRWITVASIFGICPVVVSTPAQAVMVRASDIEHVKRLFQEGRAHFEISEYGEAVESFREAYLQAEKIDDDDLRNEVMVALLFNLAQAHLFAYQIDQDPSHLRQGQFLIERYMVLEPSKVERADGQQLREQIDAKLAAHEASAQARAPELEPEVESVSVSEPEPEPMALRPGKGLIIGGSVVTGLSAVGLGLMAVGLADGPRAERAFLDAPDAAGREVAADRGARANALAIAGGVTAGALLTAGVALIVVGARKNHNAPRPQLGFAVRPGHVGVTMGTHF